MEQRKETTMSIKDNSWMDRPLTANVVTDFHRFVCKQYDVPIAPFSIGHARYVQRSGWSDGKVISYNTLPDFDLVVHELAHHILHNFGTHPRPQHCDEFLMMEGDVRAMCLSVFAS